MKISRMFRNNRNKLQSRTRQNAENGLNQVTVDKAFYTTSIYVAIFYNLFIVR